MKDSSENQVSGAEGCPRVTGGTYAFPLTYAQRQLWFINELDRGNVSYNIPWSLRLTGEVFNILNAADSDVDYYYASRLPGEPSEGASDYHFHPTIPRTARVSLIFNLP